MVNQWLVSTLSRLLPSCCPLCDIPLPPGEFLCDYCHAALPRLPQPCSNCGLPLLDAAPLASRCGSCQTNLPKFDHLIAACHYAPPITQLITTYKFHQQLYLARLFAHLLSTAVRSTPWELPEMIVPVPLHPARQRQRGYNQALEVARLVSRALAIPVARDSVQRIRTTAPQSDLNAAARIKNVRGAFALRSTLAYQHIVLLDDVVTTGNTVNEIARILKNSGVRQVDVWCIARATERF